LFEDPETATYVLQAFLCLNRQMDECIVAVQESSPPEEIRAFKESVGYVMYEVFEKVIVPICKRHPSLKPPELDIR
jgi:hypothetical protein